MAFPHHLTLACTRLRRRHSAPPEKVRETKNFQMQKSPLVKATATAEAFSGVSAYRITAKGISVKMADGQTVRVPKSMMPPLGKLSFFTVADAVAHSFR